MSSPLGLRDRKKVQVRAALVDAAMRLFHERGFDAVTVDEIAAAGDVSRRTFFRYFATKEAVVFARREAQLEAFRALLEGDPGAPFEAIRRALLVVAADYVAQRRRILQERALVQACPTLVARDLEVDRAFEAVIGDHLLGKSRRTVSDQRRARLLASAVIGFVRVTIDEWAARDGDLDLAKVGADALDLLAPIAPRTR